MAYGAQDITHGNGERADGGVQMVCPSCNATFGPEVSVCTADGSTLIEVPNAPLLTGRILDERYEIQGVVGSGGMGIVYRAYQHSMEREVAIKVLHPHYAHQPRAVKRFFREAQSASRLIHPNIVTVYDFGRSSRSDLYMVMEFLDGWTLGDLIYHRAPLSPATVVNMGLQMCSALETAHQRRLVHRDLKPDNVQLVTREGQIWVKVLDFGIARLMRDEDAGLGMHMSTVDVAGTPAYMSPEQIMGKDPDPRSDLYALGVILYEALTGERPFDDDNSVTLCMKQMNETPPPMSNYIPRDQIPPQLDALVMRLLAKDMEDRPKDCAEVKRLLSATQVGPTRGMTPPPLREQPGALNSVPTRPDATAMVIANHQGGRAGSRLRSIIDGVKAEPPKVHRTQQVGRAAKHRLSTRTGAAAFAVLMGSRRDELEDEVVKAWLEESRARGWDATTRGSVVTLRVVCHSGPQTTDPTEIVNALSSLVERARRTGLPLRGSVVTPRPDITQPLQLADLARRLAVTVPYGEVAVPSELATKLALRSRPITDVALPSGLSINCSAVGASLHHSGTAQPFFGRARELRLLGQLADQARQSGPQVGWLIGDLGLGATALMHAFTEGRQHLYVRTSPGASAWPCMTIARLARTTLGLPHHAADARVEAAITALEEPLQAPMRLLLLGQTAPDVQGTSSIASALRLLLERFAKDDALVVAIDDFHHTDEASRVLLDQLIDAATGLPWLFLLSSTPSMATLHDLPSLSTATRIDIRPLGARACNALVDLLGVATNQRGRVLAHSKGNPLAIRLLSSCAETSQLTRLQGNVIWQLLPEHLRSAGPELASKAWLSALLGDREHYDDLSVRAARLYLQNGLTPELRRWLSTKVRDLSGPERRFEPWVTEGELNPLQALARCEGLGLWSVAALEAARAAESEQEPARRLRLELDRARFLVLSGHVGAALERYDLCCAQRPSPAALDAESLLKFGEVLLNAGAHHRAQEVLTHARQAFQGNATVAKYGELSVLQARTAIRRGEPDDAMILLGRAREALAPLQSVDAHRARALEASIQEVRAEVALAAGDARSTRTNLTQARDAFRDLQRQTDAVRCHNQLARLELDDDRPARALELYRVGVELAKRSAQHQACQHAYVGLGEALIATGQIDEGAALLRRFSRADQSAATDPNHALAAIGLARAMIQQGLVDDAIRYAMKGISDALSPLIRARGYLWLGDANVASGQSKQGKAAWSEAAKLAFEAGNGVLGTAAEVRVEEFDLQERLDAQLPAARLS